MQVKKTLGGLILAGTLTLPLTAPAQAADFSDLPPSHWAYESMMTAVSLGIVQGTGDGQISPTAVMSWGQFLSIYARTFAQEAYADALARGLAWDQAGYAASIEAGFLREEDGLPVSADTLEQPISRQDAAVLLYYAVPEDSYYIPLGDYAFFWEPPMDPTLLSDWKSMDSLHQEAVAALAERYIIQGKEDGSFGCNDTIQRADGTVLIVRALESLDRSMSGEEKEITVRFMDADSGQPFLPDRQVTASIMDWTSDLAEELDIGYYSYAYAPETPERISSICDTYTLYYSPMTEEEREEADFWDAVERGEASYEDIWDLDIWLTRQGSNPRKQQLLFGDENKYRFSGEEEAQAAMTTITVPVWQISNGVKVSANMSLQVHAALAEDIQEIFTEIYNDPEQFPIHDVGGYSWRGDSATGEHNCGTAIDINANENYQVRDGQAMVGSCWEPGENPYSLPADGSVVRIFTAHGWSWGGAAWSYSTDPAEGYHDYMHFSYMGG